MDVLFGSIDVRDLLSTHDCDESSPLSAPDLRLLIDRLQIRSLHIKERVRDYVLSHHQDFADIFSRCSLAASKSEALSSDLSRALQLLSNHPVDLEIRNLATEIRSKARELEERREALGLVRITSSLLERLQAVSGDLRAGRLVQASEAVRDLKVALLIPEAKGSEDNEPVVFSLLRKKWMLCFDELQGMLSKIVENAIRFEPDHGRLRVNSWLSVGEMDDIKLQRVLEAMDMIGVLDYGLAKVADLIIKHVMNPLISNGSVNVFVEDLNLDFEKKAEAILSLVPSSEVQGCLDGPSIYPRLIQVMKFIYKFICFQNGKWMRCFGRLTWSRISDLVITFFLSKAVPDDASEIAKFQNIIKYTVEFETSLKEMMFISVTDNKEEKLSFFAHNVEVHFAYRKKNEILAKARNLVLQCDFVLSPESMLKGNTSEYAVDLLFQQERCFVSKAAFHLMELVHQTLKDVCLSSRRVAMEFYHAARDALLLYKAIVPVKHEKQMDNISQAAIIIHNDFLYLSQEIIGLAFEYRADFPHGIKELAVFVDMAPDFRQMAEDILQKQVQLVSSSLKEAIDGADGFQNTHQMQHYESAKFGVDQVVFILEKVHITWEPLLAKSAYKRTMCILLDFVFSSVSKDMLLLDDMAAEETLQLQRLIHLTLENLSSLFESLVADANGKENVSRDCLWIQIDEMIPSFHKFRKLADLLDMPLKSITTTWENGELANCGFTSAEVENFVKAIFTDSPLRKECLWRIENKSS